ncbi:MAG TPA: universal stress protein [Phenylobacterium sp.]
MYKHILAPTDGSDVAQRGVAEALSLAKATAARLTIITVTERLPIYPRGIGLPNPMSAATIADYTAGQEQAATSLLAGAKQSAQTAGVPVDTLLVSKADPAEAIIEAAKARDCDLIVMASHGRRGLGRLLLGSKTAEVVTQSPCPVLVVR